MPQDVLDKPRAPTGRWLGLAGFAAAVGFAALIGGLAAAGAVDEYAELSKPSWAPPSWLFGPVWAVLYALMAYAGWRVWRVEGWTQALSAWSAQLVLNAAWTPVFFGVGRYGIAFGVIVALWLVLAATVAMFFPLDRLAGWLMVPYWLWVSFAAALSAAIWWMSM